MAKTSKRQEKRNMGKDHYVCSSQTEHLPGCDGECGVLHPVDVLIAHEMEEWRKAGMRVEEVNHKTFYMDVQIRVLIKIMIEWLGVEEDKMNDLYREMLLQELISFRERFAPEIQKARIAAAGMNGMPPPGLLGPDGRPL